MSSQQVIAIKRYSASAEDNEIVFCFLLFHEIKEFPRKTQYPVVERRVTGHPAQSASQKAFNRNKLCEENKIPCHGVLFKYLKTHKAAP